MKEGVAERQLLDWFLARGYVRSADWSPRPRDSRSFRKGYEVRFVLLSITEVRTIRELAEKVGLKGGRIYEKHSRIVLPFYGEAALDWFLTRLPRGLARDATGFAASGRRLERRPRSAQRRS